MIEGLKQCPCCGSAINNYVLTVLPPIYVEECRNCGYRTENGKVISKLVSKTDSAFELKQCPFCGCKDVKKSGYEIYECIYCNGCGIMFMSDNLVDDWNRRNIL